MEPVGLHKCKTPLRGGVCIQIRSGKEVLRMHFLLLLMLLRVIRTRRFRLRIEFDL
jgi:hypothetical protein